jgi:hypothetical protein
LAFSRSRRAQLQKTYGPPRLQEEFEGGSDRSA